MTDKRYDPSRRARLLRAERWQRWDPPRTLARLDVQPGQTVLDLGCGPGFWTLPLAELVGATGTVWALDVSQEMLAMLADRQPPPQVRLLRGELPAIDLPAASIDLAWAAFLFHEVEPPEQLAAELGRVVRPGGRVFVLDWRPGAPGESGPPLHHRLAAKQVGGYLQAAGFQPPAVVWRDEDVYLMAAERSPGDHETEVTTA